MGVHLDPGQYQMGEEYLYQCARAFNVRFELVPSALIPLERCGRMNISGSVVPCRHKNWDDSFQGVPKLGADVLVPGDCASMA